MRRLILVAAVLSMAASCPKPPQPPQPPEPPAPPSPICEPGETCGCWHQPPGEDWQQLPPCPPGPPQPPEPPTPPPAGEVCPKELAPGTIVYLNDKAYGQGWDSTVRVKGDPVFCQKIHGVALDDCHLEGWPKRVECEMALIGGCPIWQFTRDEGNTSEPCVDNQYAFASCDHFGSVQDRDDPKTPAFEGKPEACGLQRDEHGPIAGFFTIAHGKAWVRACKPDGKGCGPWRPFDH